MNKPARPILIRLERLKALGACQHEQNLFRSTFGESVEFTPEAVERARAAGLSLYWLASQKTAHPRVLTVLATDADACVRRCVANNPSTPASVLATLATDADAYVRRCVANNPSTPASVLATLATDADACVRWHVANNPSTPASVLATLATDADACVRWHVANNPSTPKKSRFAAAGRIDLAY